MKTEKEYLKALLEGKTLVNDNGEEAFFEGDDLNGSYYCVSPESWHIKEEKKKYTMFRYWFLDECNNLHYIDYSDTLCAGEIKCTCCSQIQHVSHFIESEVIKEIEV